MKIPFTFLLFFSFASASLKAQNMEDKYPVTILNPNGNKALLFYFTGDGGINSFSEKICDDLSKKDYPVVIFNSRKYFWKQKLPDIMAANINEIVAYYIRKLNKKEFSLIGYSFGADALIFYNNRIQPNLFSVLKSTVLLSPSVATDFTIKLSDLLGMDGSAGTFKTLPEILKIKGNTLCLFGEKEDHYLYNNIGNKTNIKKILLPGSHKYDNDTNKVIATILTSI